MAEQGPGSQQGIPEADLPGPSAGGRTRPPGSFRGSNQDTTGSENSDKECQLE